MSHDLQIPANPAVGEPNILVIDDDLNNLAIATDLLKDFNYTILVAEDGESGLERAKYASPDLILLDIMMPGIDGFETCRRLKAQECTKNIPVIFMTALSETEHKVRGFEAGAVDYVTKPFQREVLLARVGVHLHIRELTNRLRDANEFLEKRVVERTDQLARANSELYVEIAERKQAQEALKQANEELENRVAERTLELEKNRAELELQNKEILVTYHRLEQETAQRLRMMEELREKDRLLIQQTRMAAMGEMLGNIAHFWRQPLNVLGLTVQEIGLACECGLFSKEMLDSSIEKSMEIIQQLSQSINDFRELTVPDKESSLFRVDVVVTRTVALIEENFRQQGIALNTNIMGQPEVNGYPNGYAQVLLNILINARDAFQERGTPEARISLCLTTENGRSILTVTDNAGGIKEDIIERIFDAFFTTRDSGRGTGVGLFMAKTLIEKKMGGRITVRNITDGAEFRVEV